MFFCNDDISHGYIVAYICNPACYTLRLCSYYCLYRKLDWRKDYRCTRLALGYFWKLEKENVKYGINCIFKKWGNS